MRLLLDEMFPPSVTEGLRRRGIDAVAIREMPSMRGLPDPEVFVAAQLDERCLVTENVPDLVQVEQLGERAGGAASRSRARRARRVPTTPQADRRPTRKGTRRDGRGWLPRSRARSCGSSHLWAEFEARTGAGNAPEQVKHRQAI